MRCLTLCCPRRSDVCVVLQWNRDRFVLSNGHGCSLQYILLHLTGFGVTMDDLKNFRQIDSITPGRQSRSSTKTSASIQLNSTPTRSPHAVFVVLLRCVVQTLRCT